MKELVGTITGKLTVVRYLRGGGRGIGSIWLCRCECGNELEALGKRIAKGLPRSCVNCKAKLYTTTESSIVPRGYRRGYNRYVRATSGDTDRGSVLTAPQFIKLASKDCRICGAKLARGIVPLYPTLPPSPTETPSVIIPVPVCIRCQDYKPDIKWSEWLAYLRTVISRGMGRPQ